MFIVLLLVKFWATSDITMAKDSVYCGTLIECFQAETCRLVLLPLSVALSGLHDVRHLFRRLIFLLQHKCPPIDFSDIYHYPTVKSGIPTTPAELEA